MKAQIPLDFELLAAELVRSVRGRRSQTALSRRLGYSTNVVYLWEAQKASPAAAGFFGLLQKSNIDVQAALDTFYRGAPAWAAAHSLTTRQGVARFLEDQRGSRAVSDVARSLSVTRFALSRWLKAEAEPRLPEFLQVLEVMSLRLLDFLAVFVDPLSLPSVRERWMLLQHARRAAYERPWSHAVLRLLEVESYQSDAHQAGRIAEALGISAAEEQACLELLLTTGQIELHEGRYQVARVQTTDTRPDPRAALALKAWWSEVGLERLRAGAPGVFSYNLFAVSNADLARLEALQRAYFRELRSIVAASTPAENVAVVNLQLFSLLS